MRIGRHWERARELVFDPATGRTTTRLLPTPVCGAGQEHQSKFADLHLVAVR
jgi:hypothetical protein